MHFDRNMDVLRAVDPELAARVRAAVPGGDLERLVARTGAPSARVGGTTLHSVYDPEREARDWVAHHRAAIDAAASICVLGFGLGYHVAALREATGVPVTVFEPRADVLRLALESLDLSGVLGSVRVTADDSLPPGRGTFRILPHRPSVEASPGYFAHLAPRLESLRAIRRGLDIAVVGPIYGGSLPLARYCADALRNIGHEAELVDASPLAPSFHAIDRLVRDPVHRDIVRGRYVEFASEVTMARLVALKPDLVLALAQAPLAESAYRILRERKVPVAYWFVEDFRRMTYWRRIAPLCEWFFTIQRGEFHRVLRETGAARFAYLPTAASPALHRPMSLDAGEAALYGSDLSFVGAGYYNRRKLFEALLDRDLKIWGNEWDLRAPLGRCIQRGGARIGTQESVKIFNAARINLNLHSSTCHEGVDPRGDFVNPRTFEIAACGAFQLVDSRSELPALFRVGREIVCFDGLADLRDKIDRFLARPDERREIADRARARVLAEHTYEHRMETMLAFIAEHGFEPPAWGPGEKSDPRDLAALAGRDTDLGRYLARFAHRTSLRLSDAAAEIRAGRGPLSRVERMLLALHEMTPRAGEGDGGAAAG